MRNNLLKISNFLLFVLICATFSAGLILEYRLPNGRMFRDHQLMGFTRHDWREVHFYCSLVLAVITLVHLWLNRSWIAKVATKGNRPVMYLSLLFGCLVVLGPFLIPVQQRMP